ncbi:hypothetical protein QVD17_39784 [Tagetes erecta]|uniref:Uncharacterized protein n=1 Tax=Tagetes erecta TaxID=13708 RepID=A0AAD8NAF4_TARER|nr:hypothetical protein QVD17_39784 [Tagetes erecta]
MRPLSKHWHICLKSCHLAVQLFNGQFNGENDIEMHEMASLGITLSNGAKKTKVVANIIDLSNDEAGVAKVIYRRCQTLVVRLEE